jgi:integrase
MARRGNGEGTIRRRKDGTWEARYTIGRDPATGRQKQKSIYGRTRKECADKLADALAAIADGEYIEPNKRTLYEWIEYWLWNVKKGEVKPKTFDSYRETAAVHIGGTLLAKMKLASVRRHHVQSWVDEKKTMGTTPRIIRYAYGIIRNSMNDAVRRGLLSVSHADKVSLPSLRPKPVAILTQEQQGIFIEAIRGHRLEAMFYLALTTGMREGEIAALRWSDYDGKEQTLAVSRDAIRVNEYDPVTKAKTGTKVIVQDTPKSRAGRRVIPLLPETVQSLLRHRARQLDEKMRNRKLYEDSGLIFCNEIGGLYDPKAFYSALQKICKATDGLVPIKFHALRHTFATRGLEAEISGKAMQGLLGHETEAMTLHYQQILKTQARKEMDKLKGVF